MKDEKDAGGDSPMELKARTKQLAIRVIRLYSALPNTTVAQVLGKQLLRCGTSVGAHYREGLRSRSNAEFISKIQGALQELEGTAYWLELLEEIAVFPEQRLAELQREVNELTAILTTCVENAKSRRPDG